MKVTMTIGGNRITQKVATHYMASHCRYLLDHGHDPGVIFGDDCSIADQECRFPTWDHDWYRFKVREMEVYEYDATILPR